MFFRIINSPRASISTRLTVFFVFSFALCLAATFAFTYLKLSYSLEKLSREVISSKMRELDAVIEKGGLGGLASFINSDEERVRNAPFLVRVLTESGEAVFSKTSQQQKTFDFATFYGRLPPPRNTLGWRSIQAVDDEDTFDILTEHVGRGLYLQIGKSSEDRDSLLESVEYDFAWATVIFVVLSVGLALWYARRALRPLANLTNTILQIEHGEFSRRVPDPLANDELRELSRTFNRMIDRIERLVTGMKQSVDNLAHDIRTPLTRARARAEAAILSGDQAEACTALEDVTENLNELTALVDQLLDISEAESGALKLKLQLVEVSTIGEQVVDLYQVVAEDRQIKLVNSIQSGILWPVDRLRIKRVIANLVDNAIKFSPSEATVEIRGFVQNDQLVLEVLDRGHGVDPASLPFIWDRLYQADASRSEKGSGLGLALVRSIVEAHGGSVEVNETSSAGSCFRVIFPPASSNLRTANPMT